MLAALSQPSKVPDPPVSSPSSVGAFWNKSQQALFAELQCGIDGLRAIDVASRRTRYGPNSDAAARRDSVARALLRRLLEPLSLILLAAGAVSMITGDGIGGSIIVAILSISIGLDTVQEGHAVRAAEVLRRSVALKAEVKRDGAFVEVEVDQIVPGDVLRVRAGDIIAADALILESTGFTAGEAALTGDVRGVRIGVPTNFFVDDLASDVGKAYADDCNAQIGRRRDPRTHSAAHGCGLDLWRHPVAR